jgi:ribosomal protein S12
VEGHVKLIQTYRPLQEEWQREVNRIISAGTRVESMVYDIKGVRYKIDLDGCTITAEEL